MIHLPAMAPDVYALSPRAKVQSLGLGGNLSLLQLTNERGDVVIAAASVREANQILQALL